MFVNLLREYIRASLMEENSNNQYVRFGLWPENERSIVRVTDDETYEEGVSVFHTKWNSQYKKWEIWASDYGVGVHDPIRTLQAYITKMRVGQMPVFLVSGDLVGTGYDREPLLRNVKKIKELSCEDILAPQYENPQYPSDEPFGTPGREKEDCGKEAFEDLY